MNKKQFSSSNEVFEWLSNFINLERGQKPKSFRLDRMTALSELAGNPQKCAPSIHIAGSKGKGSVTGMITSILTSAGFRTARYMSPHVIDIRERLCLGDSYFSEEVYVCAGNELKNVTENLLPASKNPLFDAETPEGAEPTFWELLTFLFFLCARHANCDIMVVETGLGGRLDSTNVLEPLVSVITLIELEHTGMLGKTITAVAGEKAGIIKQGKPLVLARQCETALKVFKKVTEEKNSPLFYLPQITEISNIKVTKQVTDFILTFKSDNTALSLSVPIPGKVQAENAALAIAAINAAFLNSPESRAKISDGAFKDGLKNLNIPGRFEKLNPPGDTPSFIIDGAHTPESLDLCIETFCSLYGEGGVLLFGCAADKDATAMAKIAHSHFAKIIITTPGTFKMSDCAKVHEIFAQTAGCEKTRLIADTHEAIKTAREFAAEKRLPILGTGSFYLVSEIRKFVFCAGD
ncbi:MAG: tetrahydrofolate synthase [Treponema sp.]|nr:tetrahydrofolate synthase [Treponema sp.]